MMAKHEIPVAKSSPSPDNDYGNIPMSPRDRPINVIHDN